MCSIHNCIAAPALSHVDTGGADGGAAGGETGGWGGEVTTRGRGLSGSTAMTTSGTTKFI